MSVFDEADVRRLDIAVIGSGIAGLAASWLLGTRHRVTLYERDGRLGGHSNTVDLRPPAGSESPALAVDTGFMVYNEATYPNLTALFRHLAVPTAATDMSFAVSLDDGRVEYGGGSLGALFAQRRNLLRPRFWAMLRDVLRFYREAPELLLGPKPVEGIRLPEMGLREIGSPGPTLGRYLDDGAYSRAFVDDHLLPMIAAIWSAPTAVMRDYPAAAMIDFCRNHGLLQLRNRPAWRRVVGGSREYVRRLAEGMADRLRLGDAVRRIRRETDRVLVEDRSGSVARFDRVVVATHANDALALLGDPSPDERALLGAFRYRRNEAVLHGDRALMPRRQRVWSSWNYTGRTAAGTEPELSVTYWLNRLQAIDATDPVLVTLNPYRRPRPETLFDTFTYEHPLFDGAAIGAQRQLWRLQGRRNTWFCGAYFGAGFHEDGLQSGLAAAEELGDVRRPWTVPEESGRIHLRPVAANGESAADPLSPLAMAVS